MTRSILVGRLLRVVAIGIAIAAAVDPSITSNRTTKPEVAVVAVDPGQAALSDRVAGELSKAFTVIRAPVSNADATVLVGDALPSVHDGLASPAFAVLSDRDGPTVTLDGVHAPAWSPADARVPVATVAHVTGARGRTLDLTLRSGDLVVDHMTHAVASDDERIALSLGFVPTAPGAAALHVVAAVDGGRAPATTDIAVDVRDKRWAVLFFDPRPSWMSTFARRAVERDARFVVTSRVVTSRNVSTDVGSPPGRLDDLAALSLFDVVVVGAPEALTANDVAGLDAFLRRRGGSVVLLFDRRVAGPYEQLTQVAAWAADSGKAVSITLVGADSGALRSSEITWPARLPAGAEAIVRTSARDSAASRPVVWRSAVGAGQLIVSGALDAWRFRDRAISAFDRFWQNVVADAAFAAPPAISVSTSSGVVAPGGETEVAVILRDAALSTARPARASVDATLESTDAIHPPIVTRLWPDAGVGEFRGAVKAPTAPGVYRLVVSGNGTRAELPIVVANSVSHPTADARDLLAAWVGARGGRVFPATQLQQLSSSIRDAIRPSPRLETWHPMRSAWWIVPFALALSGEWWLRRRRGLS